MNNNRAIRADAYDEYMFEEHWSFDPPPDRERKDACQDIFQAFFRKRWEFADDAPPDVKRYLEGLQQTEEYKTLREATVRKSGPSYEAALRIYGDYCATATQPPPTTPDQQRRQRQRMRDTVQRAEKAAEAYENMEELLGLGPGCTDEGGDMKPVKDRIRMVKKFLNNPELVRLMRLCGRVVNLAESSYKTDTCRGAEHMVGVERGDDLSRTLPGELWAVMEPKYFMTKFVEKTLLQYRFEGDVAKGRGPIVMCVDISGSMRGSSFDYARGVMFGLIHIAVKQQREIMILPFNTEVSQAYKVTSLAAFAEWVISVRPQGGTSFSKPLRRAMEIIATQDEKADIVFLTDGNADIAPALVEEIQKRREEKKLKVMSVSVDRDVNTATLASFSDEVITLDALLAGDGLTVEAANATTKIFQGVL